MPATGDDQRNQRTETVRRANRRSVHDDAGVSWDVFERRVHGRMYLFFESSVAFRRITEYPGDWSSLADEVLLSLSWGR